MSTAIYNIIRQWNRSIKYSLIFSTLLMFFFISQIGSGCKKQNTVLTSQISNDTYLRTFSFPGFQSGHCLKETEDGNMLLFWIDYTDTTASQISKIDLNGNILWRHKVRGNLDGSYFVTLNDGSILISSWGTFIKLDKNGQVLIENFPPSGGGFPVAVESPGALNGFFLLASTNGGGTGGPSTNTLSFLDKDGKDGVLNDIIFPDAYFNCKVVRLNIFRYEEPHTFYFWGAGYINWTGNWTANPHIFFAKLNMNTSNTALISKKVLFVDSADNINFYDYNWVGGPFQVTSSDKSVLVSISLTNVNTGLIHGHLMKVDSNLNLLWTKDMPFENLNNEVHAIENCPDGGFLVVGKTFGANSKIYTPFFCKYDYSGTLLWKNTLATPRFGEAWWGTQLRGGGYMFTGNTTSFGNDQNGQDLFILKTDNKGNVK